MNPDMRRSRADVDELTAAAAAGAPPKRPRTQGDRSGTSGSSGDRIDLPTPPSPSRTCTLQSAAVLVAHETTPAPGPPSADVLEAAEGLIALSTQQPPAQPPITTYDAVPESRLTPLPSELLRLEESCTAPMPLLTPPLTTTAGTRGSGTEPRELQEPPMLRRASQFDAASTTRTTRRPTAPVTSGATQSHESLPITVQASSLPIRTPPAPRKKTYYKRAGHGEERKYDCEVEGCASSFHNRGHLNQHARAVHNGERKHTCQEVIMDERDGVRKPVRCGAKFASLYALNQHVQTVHHNLQRFSCMYCSAFMCGQRSHLNRHLRQKHPDRPVPKVQRRGRGGAR